jgi:type I restriction enzyme R subunit
MTDKITENTIENFCIKLLEKQGYEYIYAPDIAPDSDKPLRSSFEDVLLSNRLTDAIARINPSIPRDTQIEAIKEISRIHSPELLSNNESFVSRGMEGFILAMASVKRLLNKTSSKLLRKGLLPYILKTMIL